MPVEYYIALLGLLPLLCDRSIGIDPIHARSAWVVVRDEQVFTGNIHAVVHWTPPQLDWLAMRLQRSGAWIHPERGHVMLVARLTRPPCPRGHIEEPPRRVGPCILNTAIELDRA